MYTLFKQRVQGPDHVGRLLLCGATNWDLYNRKQAPKGCKNTAVKNLYTPHRFGPLDDVRVRAVASGCSAAHSIIITEEYKVYTLGKYVLKLPVYFLLLHLILFLPVQLSLDVC